MAKKSKKMQTEKKPSEPASSESRVDGFENASSTINHTMESADNQDDFSELDGQKGRHFWFVVYPTEDYVKKHYPDCQYDGSDGWGTAPDDWIEKLRNTGLAFNVSPLHYLDKNPDGAWKKPHWHSIVSWGNTTTYRSARALCDLLNCPVPQLLKNVTGAYRYHKHLDNPEKYQYTENSVSYNGWTPPLDSNEVTRIKKELKELVLVEDIQEYAELLIVCDSKGDEYFDVASNNTFYCEKLCSSYRHNPVRVLMRFYGELPEGETKEFIRSRIEEMTRKD